MKLLLDGNVSDGIVPLIADLFPGSAHIKSVGLKEAEDSTVWDWAKRHEFTIVSKDTDFHQRAILFGHPPKFIWLRVGNSRSRKTQCLKGADGARPSVGADFHFPTLPFTLWRNRVQRPMPIFPGS